jgi:hypothetical protein
MLCVWAGGMCFTRSAISVLITTRNEMALSAKHTGHGLLIAKPQPAVTDSVAAKSSGPSTRAILN